MVNLKLDQDRAVFVVEDAGSGLPKHFYTEGIQHFQRYDKSRSRASGGSGLGMSIMAAIVERHGGSIDLSASMLGGLCITVKLPAHSLS
jgi:K+-sensing histidine kinase KdpD